MNIKDKKYIITLGCSFSTSNDENLVERGHTFGDVIAKHYGMELVELGVPGGSNQHIKNRFFEWFGKNPNKWNDTFVVVAWTSPGRHMWWNNKTKEWFNDTNQIYIKDTVRFNKDNLIHGWSHQERTKYAQNFLQNDYDEMRSYVEQVVTLQSCMKSWGIPYIMFNSLFDERVNDSLIESESNNKTNRIMWDTLIDTKYFYRNEEHIIFGNMMEPPHQAPNKDLWIRENDSHPNKKAHKIWGDYLIEFIGKVHV